MTGNSKLKTRNSKPAFPTRRNVQRSSFRVQRSAFTLMELMVSIAILIIIILAIGVTFSGASNSVGTSQAMMDQMSAVRAMQAQINDDLQHLDKNGFLVIRSRIVNPSAGDFSYRCDQLTFMANGSFPNHSGANTTTPFTDSSSANAGIIWWGHGVMEAAQVPSTGDFYLSTNSVGQGVTPGGWPGVWPTGIRLNAGPNGSNLVIENESTLLRHVLLLYPGTGVSGTITPAGNPIMAYGDATYATSPVSGIEGSAQITSSRYAAVAQTPAQILLSIAAKRAAGDPAPELDLYSYRFRALASIYDTEVGSFVNGYFRTTPIVMTGVPSFRVEWTDGHYYTTGPLQGQLIWFGPTQPATPGANLPTLHSGTNNPDPNMELYNSGGAITTNGTIMGDQYDAIFNSSNRAYWPTALRITIHVYNDRLGGRDFTQIVNLPQ